MPRVTNARDLTPADKLAVVLFLSESLTAGRLDRGAINAASRALGFHRQTIAKVWRERATLTTSTSSRRAPRGARYPDAAARVQAVALPQRQTMRALASATRIPRSTLSRYVKSGLLRRRTSRVKPALTDTHKKKRLEFALAHVHQPLGKSSYEFDDMYDVVHVDEKWFNMYRASTTYYLSPMETIPYRACPNKRYIGKVMFLAAVARPRYDTKRNIYFDGKIGVWPVVELVQAARSSHNRPAGTWETKSVSMNNAKYVELLIKKVFPAIRKKWPVRQSRPILVQQDNASPHGSATGQAVQEAGQLSGWDIRVVSQPPRSPDMNILDLGIFNSIQAVQYRRPTNQTDALIAAVRDAFDRLPSRTVDKCFLTLQRVMECVIRHNGCNDFPLPRVGKKFIHNGVIPVSLSCPASVVEAGIDAFKEMK